MADPSTSSAAAVPRFLDVGARWAWRFVVICAAGAIVLWLVARLRVVMIPVFVALILTALFSPLVEYLARRLPRLLATWVTLLAALVVIVVGGLLLGRPIASATGDLGTELEASIDDLQDWLVTGPLDLEAERVDSVFDDLSGSGDRVLSGLADQPASTARLVAEVVGGVLLTLVVMFFLLKDGRRIWDWVLEMVRPVRRPKVDVAGRAAFESVQGWIKGVAITGLADGFLIGVALVILGVPAAIPLAVITAFVAFFPIIGATVAGALAALVALASNGLTTALIVVAVVLVVQQVEGDVLLPLVMRRQVSLHPIVILVALAVGGAIAGLVGALVSVPIAAAATAAIAAVNDDDVSDPDRNAEASDG